MIVLGLDTSGYANAVGVINGDTVLADIVIPARTDSLEQIVANIDDVLKNTGLKLEDVDGIGVGLGPGSWTGIRVGVTVGKMLALAAEKPVAGVATLETLAYSAGDTDRLIVPVISVGAGDAVYAGLYHYKGGNLVQEGEYYVGDSNGLTKLIKEPCVIIGTDINIYNEKISRVSKQDIIALERQPSGAGAAALAEKRLVAGQADNALSLQPLYLKEATAKVFVNKYAVKQK